MRRHSTRQGFTLIEIMVTLAILGTSLVVLMSAFATALRLHDSASEEVRFRTLFEWAMGEAEVALLAGETSGGGECGARYPGYTWSYSSTLVASETAGNAAGSAAGASTSRPGSLSSSSANDQQDDVQLFEIEVKVTPPTDGPEARSMTFLVYNTAGAEIETGLFGGRGSGNSGGAARTGGSTPAPNAGAVE